jgi:amino acid transporter
MAMEVTLNVVIAILLLAMVFIAYQTFIGLLNLIKYKGSPEYQRWRKRVGKLDLVNSIEKTISIFLVVITVVIIILLIVWGKNQ